MVLELEWGRGGSEAAWDGYLEIEGGRIQDAWNTLLDVEDSYSTLSDNRINWESLTRGSTDGIGMRVRGSMDDKLTIVTRQGEVSAKLKDILNRPKQWKLGKNGKHVLEIRRQRKSIIHLAHEREHYVFRPAVQWALRWNLDLVLPSQQETIEYQLKVTDDFTGRDVAAYRKGQIATGGKSKHTIEQEITLPEEEGVYSLYVQTNSSELEVPELRVQFVVLDPDHGVDGLAAGADPGMQLVDEIHTADSHGNDRYRDDGSARVVNNHQNGYRISGNLSGRPPGSEKGQGTRNWFAYRLRVKNPGRPHIAEISYPRDKDRRFVVSLLDQGEGAIGSNGIDQGVIVRAAADAGEIGIKRLVFWPSTTAPAVAFVNAMPGSSAAVIDIKLYEMRHGLPARTVAHNVENTLRGPFFEEAHLPRALGAAKVADPGPYTGGKPRADWTTYYSAITHLAEWLRYRGENAAMIPVFAYGGSLYPSGILPNNGRYDDGMEFTDGRDAAQKDVVRLILEIFERNGLTLIPEFAFYTKLPRLEEAFPPDAHGVREIDLINKNGRSSRQEFELEPMDRHGPYYNPLHPAVQQEVRMIVREFIRRYSDSPALGDIALRLNTTGWVQFPGMKWGYDMYSAENYMRTEHAEDLTDDNLQDPMGLFNYLNADKYESGWIKWRNTELGKFYGSLAREIREVSAWRSLVLAYVNIFTSRYADDNVVAALQAGREPRDLLAAKGVDPLAFAGMPGIRIWRPVRAAIPPLDNSDRRLTTKWQRAGMSRDPRTIALFQRAGSSGAVEHNDYFEGGLNSLARNWWWRLRYQMVATIRDFGDPGLAPLPDDTAYFYGGWQVAQ